MLSGGLCQILMTVLEAQDYEYLYNTVRVCRIPLQITVYILMTQYF